VTDGQAGNLIRYRVRSCKGWSQLLMSPPASCFVVYALAFASGFMLQIFLFSGLQRCGEVSNKAT
jgi:hypothetical protein